MNVYNGRAMVAKRKVENPDKFKVCPACGENKAIRMFSLIDKTDASHGHRDVCKRCSAKSREVERRNRSWKDDLIGTLWKNTRARAKAAGIEHTLTREDIIIPEFCPVLGIKLHTEDRKAKFAAPSIDRIDNSKGYTPDNIVVVSVRANILKRDATLTEMRALVKFYDTLVEEHPGLL
jgi:hypothetical protein